jgi:hypothetical protein
MFRQIPLHTKQKNGTGTFLANWESHGQLACIPSCQLQECKTTFGGAVEGIVGCEAFPPAP